MLGLCALPSALSKPVQRRKILFSTESIPDFNALPLQARPGLLFLFLPVLCPSALPHPPMGRRFPSHPGLPVPLDSSTTAPHGFNRAGNPFCWCRSPTRISKSHTGAHRPGLVLTVFSWGDLALAGPPSPALACNLPPPEWGGW